MSTDTRVPTGDGDQEQTFYWYAESGYWQDVDDPVGSPSTVDYIGRTGGQYWSDKYCLFSGSGFSVPAGSTITKVEVIVYAKAYDIPPM